MGDIEPWLVAVAEAARTLRERLAAGERDVWSVEVQRAWLEAVGTDLDGLARRSTWSLPAPAGRPAERAPGEHRQPAWVALAADISCATAAAASLDAVTPPADARPFAALLGPAVAVARRRLASALGPVAPEAAGVSHVALTDLEDDLFERLLTVAGRVLDVEFGHTRPPGRALLIAMGATRPPAGRRRYDAFVERHTATGWRLLFELYPVLARLLSTTVLHWVEATAELLRRLAADRAALSALGVAPDAEVTRFQPSISDRHRGGRTAVIIAFDGGARVVYKPKPVAAESVVSNTIDWLNTQGLTPALLATPVLARDGYGWAAFVEHRPCSSPSEVHDYFTRAGMLLALLHVLRTTDAHYENVVAAGDQPVLVDCETILYPDPRPLVGSDDTDVPDPLLATVLRTGFLPCWQEVDGRPYDSSGLSGLDGSTSSIGSWEWADVGTDDLRLTLVPRDPESRNRARLDGTVVSAAQHEHVLADGFRRCYELLLRHRDELTGSVGPLRDAAGTPIRFIFRPTRVYGAVLASALAPELLTDGISFGTHLERLAGAFVGSTQRPNTWPVFEAELRALERLDVPIFTLYAGTTGLTLDDGTVLHDVFETDTVLGLRTALDCLSVQDCHRQAGLISAAFAARAARLPTELPADFVADPPTMTWDSGRFVEQACRIGADLLAHAIPTGSGGLTWVGPSLLERIGRYRLGLVGTGFYDGAFGVAAFLAGLANVTGERHFEAAAMSAIQDGRQRIRDLHRSGARDYGADRGLGLAVGLGGDLYGLVCVARSCTDHRATLLEEAAALTSRVLPEAVAADTSLDVLSGAAGTLLALLALHEALASSELLATAVAVGDHLLAARTEQRDRRVWATVSGRVLTGFSHGVAGIAYALARLHATSGEPRFLEAAAEAIAFERDHFDEAQGNWPDLRDEGSRDPSGFCVKWCHGAAGIALGRAGVLKFAPIDGVPEEIAVGARTTAARLAQQLDIVCCGTFGRIEALLLASDVLPASPWRTVAVEAAASVVEARRRDGFRLNGLGERESPGFFQGMSGIGYQLLRLAQPALPSILLLE